MKLSVNHSQALLDLIRAGHVRADAVEWVDKLPLSLIVETREFFPSLAFDFTAPKAG